MEFASLGPGVVLDAAFWVAFCLLETPPVHLGCGWPIGSKKTTSEIMKIFGKIIICLVGHKMIDKSDVVLNSIILSQPNKYKFYKYFHHFTPLFFNPIIALKNWLQILSSNRVVYLHSCVISSFIMRTNEFEHYFN